MPIGVIVNALSVVIGGAVGAVAGNKLSMNFKEKLNMIFGACSMGMGISTIVLMKNMPAVIFACTLGAVVCVVAIPQFIIFFILFLLAGFIYPMTNETMIADFKACGGFIMLATGFRMIKVKMFPSGGYDSVDDYCYASKCFWG